VQGRPMFAQAHFDPLSHGALLVSGLIAVLLVLG
jgi:hypothetical protein